MNSVKHSGFTLIELLTVILILSIIMTIVGPMYKTNNKSDVKVIARKLMSELRYARSLAISQGKKNAVIFEFSKRSYYTLGKNEVNKIPDNVKMNLMLDLINVNKKNGKIVFFPDGSSSGGTITLENNGRKIKVVTTWLHGAVSINL